MILTDNPEIHPGYFEDMWGAIFQRSDVRSEPTKEGLAKLVELLEQLKEEYAIAVEKLPLSMQIP